jgi:DNA-binding response OmpR family regulator
VRRLLVVEDYPPLAKVIAIGAKQHGHEVVRAGSVQRALATEGTFDVAILDLDLPDGSGLELADALLREGRAHRVVFFTASRDQTLRRDALHYGPVLDKERGIEALMTVTAESLQMANVVNGAPAPAPGAGRSGTRRRVT